MVRRSRPRPLGIPEQISRMRMAFPSFTMDWRCGRVRWRGPLQPTELSAEYITEVSYRLGQWPKVRVLEPPIVRRAGRVAPHRYADDSLCLFHPKRGEWAPAMAIAETIVPWASLWLYYYEVWLATGEWIGGGEHPRTKEQFLRRVA